MTAPTEPLAMTLGEALSVLQNRGLRLVPPEKGADSWGTSRVASWDAPDHEFDTWPEAVSDALGRTVVDADDPAREDAAELRTAAQRYLDAEEKWQASDRKRTTLAVDAAVAKNALRAALAATEARSE